MDTIKWDALMFYVIETGAVEYDMGSRIHVINGLGKLSYEGDWTLIDGDLIKFQNSTNPSLGKRILFVKLADDATGLVLPHQLYASDVDAYTIIAITARTKPEVVFDGEIILTELRDLDNDGFVEFIGRHPDYGIPEYTNCFVPFQVLKYTGSLALNSRLTYEYNLPYKKYREYPEGSIIKLTENDLKKYSTGQLRIMRNEIFADHGYVFESKDLKEYFSKKSWYKPLSGRPIILTDWEKHNVELLKNWPGNK
jgi:hypothetical protein